MAAVVVELFPVLSCVPAPKWWLLWAEEQLAAAAEADSFGGSGGATDSLAAAFELELEEPPPPPTVAWIAEMDNILLIMRFCLGARFGCCGGGCCGCSEAAADAQEASPPPPRTLASSAAARCLAASLLADWPEVAEELQTSCEAVIWRWNMRPPPPPAAAMERCNCFFGELVVDLESAAPPEVAAALPAIASAFVLSCRWNIEFVVKRD